MNCHAIARNEAGACWARVQRSTFSFTKFPPATCFSEPPVGRVKVLSGSVLRIDD